jgi:hypothetical protein
MLSMATIVLRVQSYGTFVANDMLHVTMVGIYSAVLF